MPLIHESLFWWGLPLVGVPVLIHLINLLRHRRVQWAAMEFLRVSQKRHRNWIILKQLLLLLLRMGVVAAIVAMVAQPLLKRRMAGLIGGTKTHHVVLLDDSFSMADRWTDSDAFEEAKQMVGKLAGKATQQDTPQTFTLLRFRAARQGGVRHDLLEQAVESDFAATVEGLLKPLTVSELAVGPQQALEALEQLPPQPADEDRVVYLVSDFRSKDWSEPGAVRKVLDRLTGGGAQLHFVQCVDAAHPNLAVVALRPAGGTRAAGVPLVMDVAVRNFGTTTARDVSLALSENGNSRPPVVFEELPAGKTVARQFQVQFAAAGEHHVEAELPSDHLAADNRRFAVIDVPPAEAALVIDGDAQTRDAYFIASVLAPGGKVNTGVRPRIESPRFLDNQPLASYSAVYLLNFDRLSQPAVESLEKYVRAGSGVAIFVGEQTRADFINRELYRGGKGLFPAPLGFPTELLVDRAEKTPDLQVTNHPIFAIFSGQRNSFLATVNIDRYFTVEKDWSPPPEQATQVIARLRNKAPLAIERKFGEGRVVAVLTKASPVETDRGRWNNWGGDNPSYVVTLLQLQAYLAQSRSQDAVRLVGTPLEVRFEQGKFQNDVRFLIPAEKSAEALSVAAKPSGSELVARLPEVERSGIYESQLTAPDGTISTRKFAVNVAEEEGNLATLDLPQLTARLEGLRFQFAQARDFSFDPRQLAGINLGPTLLFALVAMLIVEQLLAYSASYHPPARKQPAGGGTR